MVRKKVLVLATGALIAVAGATSAALAFRPAEPERSRTAHKPKKAPRPAQAVSAATPAASAVAASASAPAPVASAPESAMDRLQRRLAEKLGRNGTLEAGGRELKLTSRRAAERVEASD